MDFEFTEEQKMLQATIERVIKKDIQPLMASYPEDRPIPKEACLQIMRWLQPLGALGARIPIEYGGSGLGPVGLGLFYELIPWEAFETAMTTEVTAFRISLGGTESLKLRLLPSLVSGEKIAATAVSEPDAGSDPRGIKTRAVLQGDCYVLNGKKLWLSSATVADILVVVATVGRDERGRNITTPFVVEVDKSRVETRALEIMGVNQAHLGEVTISDCLVPKNNMLAEAESHAHQMLTASWLSGRACVGLSAVQKAKKALDASVEYALRRKQFGKPIGGFQLIQAMIVEMATLIEASRLLCYKALHLAERGVWCPKESSMAKYFASETALRVTSLAVEIYGALGIAKGSPVEKLYRDARVIIFGDGTIEIQKLIVGREILGIRAFA
jgi:alkylation response protein AidB-like acyl-CoA dehydrogenase